MMHRPVTNDFQCRLTETVYDVDAPTQAVGNTMERAGGGRTYGPDNKFAWDQVPAMLQEVNTIRLPALTKSQIRSSDRQVGLHAGTSELLKRNEERR
jgi:hypothetical protein